MVSLFRVEHRITRLGPHWVEYVPYQFGSGSWPYIHGHEMEIQRWGVQCRWGFATLDQMMRWFPRIREATNNEWCVVEIEIAEEYFRADTNQCIFHNDHANRLRDIAFNELQELIDAEAREWAVREAIAFCQKPEADTRKYLYGEWNA